MGIPEPKLVTGNGTEPPVEEVETEFTGYTRKFIKEPWQVVDIFHLLQYEGKGTANWSEMGAYKTSTGLWYIDRKLREVPGLTKPAILIVSSKSGKGTFLEAIPEILPEYTLLSIETQGLSLYLNGQMLKIKGLKYMPEEFDFPCICLAHYDIFSRSNRGKYETDNEGRPIIMPDGKVFEKPWTQADHIINREWDFMWCDEFHRMKDRDARWTVNLKKIKTRVGRHGSTGTGFINRPDEIWSLLNWLDRAKYGSYWKFREEFCEVDEWSGYGKVIGCRPEKKDEFRALVRSIGVRRTLDNVHPTIKAPIFKPHLVDLNPIQRKMYDAIKMELQALDQAGVPLFAANVLSLLIRLRQICVGTPKVIADYYDEIQDRRVQKIQLIEPSSKIDAVMEILEGLQWDEDAKEPLVVFSCFKDPLDLLKARLDKHNSYATDMGLPDDMMYKYIHLDVGDKDEVRYRKWHDDFPTMQYRVFMSTLQLGGESINLTPARHLVFLDRSWSPKDNSQGIGRIRRPGQKGEPVIIHINARNTTDQYIERVNQVKHGWFQDIFGAEK